MKEKRRHPRVKASIPINWGLTSECLKYDRITSFSIGGCFIQTAEAVRPLTVVYMRFFLSGRGEQLITGKVIYNLEEVGLGVEFTNLPEQDKNDFEALVNYYLVTHAR
ncbi:MAG TPA: PilZ domain-containing protein [Pyrinomonadaceae bacterium]|nr:PilZ domain-containing protein [Pyrinomonadaceae bacterium]